MHMKKRFNHGNWCKGVTTQGGYMLFTCITSVPHNGIYCK